MHLLTKITWVSMLLLFIIIMVMIFPSNLSIFLGTIFSGILLIYMVMAVLTDEEKKHGDYPMNK